MGLLYLKKYKTKQNRTPDYVDVGGKGDGGILE